MAIITLPTDFGTRDGYVGAVKGVLARNTGAQTVDIRLRNCWWSIVIPTPLVGSGRTRSVLHCATSVLTVAHIIRF